MTIEKRLPHLPGSKATPLPKDYARMVAEIFNSNFEQGIKALKKQLKLSARFSVSGHVHLNEVVLSISFLIDNQLAATTVYASSDFDPKASLPTVQDLLAHCVDAAGALFGQLLDPEKPETLGNIASQSLADLDDAPLEWTSVEIEKRKVFLKVDKANPDLDQMADEWLAKHSSAKDKKKLKDLEEETQAETEALFVTGKEPRNRGRGN